MNARAIVDSRLYRLSLTPIDVFLTLMHILMRK
jgi:hypothetical protein